MNMVPVEDFSNRVLSYVEGLNSDMVAAYVADAVIQFLKDTRLNVEYECIKVELCDRGDYSYKLHTKWRIYEVRSFELLDKFGPVPQHHYDYRVDGDTLYFNVDECCGCFECLTIEIGLITLPKRDSVEFPEFLYEDWLEAIVAYVLYKVYSMHGSKYANASAAAVHLEAYNSYVKDANINNMTRHKAFSSGIANPMV